MTSRKIDLLITDLDDTIYDWLGFYIPSFLAMVDEIHRITGLDKEDIKRSFQKVHRAHRTTEYAFSVQALDVLYELDATDETTTWNCSSPGMTLLADLRVSNTCRALSNSYRM